MLMSFFSKLANNFVSALLTFFWAVVISYNQVLFAGLSQKVGQWMFYAVDSLCHFDRMAGIGWQTVMNMASQYVTFSLLVISSKFIVDLMFLDSKEEKEMKKK
jgi:hypothetical protein